MMASLMTMILLPLLMTEAMVPKRFEVNSIANNPGIYYEPMTPVMMTSNTWKLTVTIDVQGIVDSHQTGWERLNTLLDTCIDLTKSQDNCKRALRIHSIKNLEEQSIKIQQHLKLLLREDEDLPSRKRREAPVLGFISRILGPIVGFTDYTEHEYLVKQVKDLYEDKSEIARVLNETTHILQ